MIRQEIFDGVRFRTEKSLLFKGFAVKFEAGVAATRALPAGNNKGALGLV